MTHSQIAALFKRTYNGKRNFMTPYLVEYGQAGRLVYEISKGEFMGKTLYGVTVLSLDGRRMDDLSKCCATWQDVEVCTTALAVA